MADPTVRADLARRRWTLLGCGLVVVAGLSLSGAAQAQMPNVNLMPEVKTKTPEEKEQDAITEKAYKDSLRKIPDSQAASDPWGDVRGAEKPRAAAKPKSRTGNAAQ